MLKTKRVIFVSGGKLFITADKSQYVYMLGFYLDIKSAIIKLENRAQVLYVPAKTPFPSRLEMFEYVRDFVRKKILELITNRKIDLVFVVFDNDNLDSEIESEMINYGTTYLGINNAVVCKHIRPDVATCYAVYEYLYPC